MWEVDKVKFRNYSLPDWYMISGETKARSFVLRKEDTGEAYDASQGEAELLVYDFVNYNAAPIVRKSIPVRLVDGEAGYYECVMVIDEADTAGEYGKFIYQITYNDNGGDISKYRGVLYIEGDNAVTYTISEKNYDGSVAAFSDGADMVPIKDLNITSIMAVQSGSGDPSPTNIRTFTGVSSVTLTRTAKNMVDYKTVYSLHKDNETVTLVNNGCRVTSSGAQQYEGARSPTITFKAGVTYVLSADVTINTPPTYGSPRLAIRRSSDSQIRVSVDCPTSGSYVKTYTPAMDTRAYVALFTQFDSGNTENNTESDVTFTNIQVEVGSQRTDYEDYVGNNYEFSFADAETVYGGTLDVKTGVLTVTHKLLELDGASTGKMFTMKSTATACHMFGIGGTDAKAVGVKEMPNIMCTHCQTMVFDDGKTGSAFRTSAWSVSVYSSGTVLRIAAPLDSGIDTKEKANEWLAGQYSNGTPVRIVYELNTPVKYQLTGQEVTTLLGKNTIWASNGEVELTYFADPTGKGAVR